MGTRGREIVGLDVNELLDPPQQGLCRRVVRVTTVLARGQGGQRPMKDAVAAELLQHATDELAHAGLVANRIIQLGGRPLVEPRLWYEWSGCGYSRRPTSM